MPIANFFYASPWPGMIAWALLYMLDYSLTLVGARLNRTVTDKVSREGSYELTPAFQRDVDALRPVSPKFVAILVAVCVVLWALWKMGNEVEVPQIYPVVLGILILIQVPLQMRHLANIHTFRLMRAPGAVQGHIEYSRWFTLRLSAFHLGLFAALFAVFAVFLQSWFFAGGALKCAATMTKHWQLARKAALPDARAASAQAN